MQLHIAHRYVAEIRLDGGNILSTSALEIDWIPAVEWSHFQEVRRGAAGLASVPGRASVRPQWDAHSGAPYVAGIQMTSSDVAAGRPQAIRLKFFADPVHRAVSTLVDQGRIEEGAKYTWRICAFDVAAPEGEHPSRRAFAVEEAADAEETVGTRRLRDLLRDAVQHGPGRRKGRSGDFPVFVAKSVLAEADESATAACELEAGGVLLGRLSRTVGAGEVVLEVTAQVPATEAIAEDASLRFTPYTWQAVHAAIGLRRARERIVGWWHSHPRKVWPCHACPPERRTPCPFNRPFFSGMDVAFHRTAFQGPMNVALLLSFHEDRAARHDLFGWREGLVVARDYYVLEENA